MESARDREPQAPLGASARPVARVPLGGGLVAVVTLSVEPEEPEEPVESGAADPTSAGAARGGLRGVPAPPDVSSLAEELERHYRPVRVKPVAPDPSWYKLDPHGKTDIMVSMPLALRHRLAVATVAHQVITTDVVTRGIEHALAELAAVWGTYGERRDLTTSKRAPARVGPVGRRRRD